MGDHDDLYGTIGLYDDEDADWLDPIIRFKYELCITMTWMALGRMMMKTCSPNRNGRNTTLIGKGVMKYLCQPRIVTKKWKVLKIFLGYQKFSRVFRVKKTGQYSEVEEEGV